MSNQSDNNYIYGDYYGLKLLENDIWQYVPLEFDDVGFKCIGYDLEQQCSTEKITIDWIWIYGELADGKYRLIKDVASDKSIEIIFDEFELANGEEVEISSYVLFQTDKNNKVIAEKTIIDEVSMEIISDAIFNVLVKSSRLQIDISEIPTFYIVQTVYSNNETSEMTFYEKDGRAYSEGTSCNYSLYEDMIAILE